MVMRKQAWLLMILIVMIGSRCMCSAEDNGWPRWRGPNGDGISMETDWNPEALNGGAKVLWRLETGYGYSNVSIRGNRLYTIGIKGVYCLNAETGEEIWHYSFDHHLEFQSTPIVEGKSVYALSLGGEMYCWKEKNGKLRWVRDLVSEYELRRPNYGFAASPVIEGETIILTANNSGLALNKKTGEKVWGSERPPEKIKGFLASTGTHYATPVLCTYKEKGYALLSNYEGLHFVEVKTGDVLWTYAWEPPADTYATEPLVFDSKVFITRYDREGCVLLDIGNGMPEVLWENKNLSSDTSSPVLVDGYVYGCDGGPEVGHCSLRCLDVENGKIMWEEDLRTAGERRPVTVSLIAADGKLIILEDDGTLHIAEAEPSSYNEISSANILGDKKGLRQFWTYPVLYKGKIYCKNYAGDLSCIDVSK
jgi:outer membrane protein assembly factor BamB